MKPHNEQVITLSSVLQSSIHADQKKIALNFKDIDIIDRVPLIYQNIDTLYLSSNKIKSLHGLYQFKKLTTLSLSYNLVCKKDRRPLHLNCADHPSRLKMSNSYTTSIHSFCNPSHSLEIQYQCTLIIGLWFSNYFPSWKFSMVRSSLRQKGIQ